LNRPPIPIRALKIEASTAAVSAAVHEALARHEGVEGALLPILHDVQDRLGHIPREAVPTIAEALNLSRAEVHGVVTYYHHFRSEAPGRTLVQVCRAEACQSVGAEALLEHVAERLGCKPHGTSADRAYTLEPVFCLGMCASSPAVVIGGELHARMTAQRFDALLAEGRP
jgi:formate dehydrogenase subunit gamma